MKLKLCAFLVGFLALSAQALAAPTFVTFLSVDINGYNAGGGQSLGPTQAGYQAWEAAEGLFLDPSIDWGNSAAVGLTKTFPTVQGDITATMIGVGTSRGARNRGDNAGGNPALYRDFVFAQRDNAQGFGRNFIKLQLSGLAPNQTYELTVFNREAVFNPEGLDPLASYQAWTDSTALGGVDGPAAWLDANVGVGASYQPINAAPMGVYKNPIPTLARSPVSGVDASSLANVYHHSSTLLLKSNAQGRITAYGWADPNGFGSNVQGASLLNGFQLGRGIVPEPTSLGLVGFGLIGLAGLRRRIS
jgi:hypothetical protein